MRIGKELDKIYGMIGDTLKQKYQNRQKLQHSNISESLEMVRPISGNLKHHEIVQLTFVLATFVLGTFVLHQLKLK